MRENTDNTDNTDNAADNADNVENTDNTDNADRPSCPNTTAIATARIDLPQLHWTMWWTPVAQTQITMSKRTQTCHHYFDLTLVLLLMITINDLPSQGIHLWGSLFWGIRTGRHSPRPHAVVPPDHCAHMLIIVTVVTSTRPHRKISNSDERDDFWLFLLATSTSYWFPFDFWCPVNLDPL